MLVKRLTPDFHPIAANCAGVGKAPGPKDKGRSYTSSANHSVKTTEGKGKTIPPPPSSQHKHPPYHA